MQNIFITISSILIFVSYCIYGWSIVKGQTKPHRTTKLVSLIITSLGTISLLAQHDKVAIWFIGTSAVQCLIIFALSFKFGMGKWSKNDLLCLLIVLVGILTWKITNNPALGIYASVIVDFAGMVPTLVKTYRLPDTEYFPAYLLDALAVSFTLLAIQTWQIHSYLYPLYFLIISLTMVLLITRPTLYKKLSLKRA